MILQLNRTRLVIFFIFCVVARGQLQWAVVIPPFHGDLVFFKNEVKILKMNYKALTQNDMPREPKWEGDNVSLTVCLLL